MTATAYDAAGGGWRRRAVCVARWAAPLVVLAALAAPSPAAAAWPLYGHDLANSRNARRAGPSPRQVASLSRAWTFNSPTGDFTGTPVVAGGVLVAGDNGGGIYALDAVSGRVRWSKHVGQPINGTAAIDLHAPGGATVFIPVAEENSPRLLALSLKSGAKRWDKVLTNHQGADVYGSPVFWRGTVYIGTSGPIDDDSTARGSVVALTEAGGKRRWRTFMVPRGRDGAAVWSTPAIDTATGRLYVGTGNNYHQPTTRTEDSMMALDAATGRILAHFQATSNDTFSANHGSGPDYDFGASPNLFDSAAGRHLVGEGQKSGIYWTLDRATMKLVWKTTVGPGGQAGGILGSTAYDGKRIYGADTVTGQVFALGRDGSTPWWQSFDGGGEHLSPATVAHGVLYTVEPAGSLIARDPATGTVLAKLPLGRASFGGVSAAGGALYVAVGTGPPPPPTPPVDVSGSIIAFGHPSPSP